MLTSDHGELNGAHRLQGTFHDESIRVPRELTGVPGPGDVLDGGGVASLATGKTDVAWREYVVVENSAHGRMVRSSRFKYSRERWDSETWETLVDMENDPGETRNLAGDPAFASELQRHRDMLASWQHTTWDGRGVPPIDPVGHPEVWTRSST